MGHKQADLKSVFTRYFLCIIWCPLDIILQDNLILKDCLVSQSVVSTFFFCLGSGAYVFSAFFNTGSSETALR